MPGVVPRTATRSLAPELSAASPPPMSFITGLRRAVFRCFSPPMPLNPSQMHPEAIAAPPATPPAQPAREPMLLPVANRPADENDTSDTPVQAPVPPAHHKYPFNISKFELETLAFDCNPAYLPSWFSLFLARLPTFSLDAAHLLRMPELDMRACVHSPDPVVAGRWQLVDTSLASLLLCLMKKESTHAQNFLATLSNNPTSLTSGYNIARLLVNTTTPQTSAELQEARRRIDTGIYFKIGMAREQTEAAAHQLRRDWLNTPAAQAPGTHDLIYCLIKKFPSSLSNEANLYETRLSECQVVGTPPPWTFEQLTAILAVALRREPRDGGVPQVNAAEASAGGRPTSRMQCFACGKFGHPTVLCTTKCSKCGQRSCPGNYGDPCVIHEPIFPETVLNAAGAKVPQAIRDRLAKLHASHHDALASQKPMPEANHLCLHRSLRDTLHEELYG